jgi:hypothetical protein
VWMEVEDERGERKRIECRLVRKRQRYYNIVKFDKRKFFGTRLSHAETVQLSEIVTDYAGVRYRAGWSRLDGMWILSKI